MTCGHTQFHVAASSCDSGCWPLPVSQSQMSCIKTLREIGTSKHAYAYLHAPLHALPAAVITFFDIPYFFALGLKGGAWKLVTFHPFKAVQCVGAHGSKMVCSAVQVVRIIGIALIGLVPHLRMRMYGTLPEIDTYTAIPELEKFSKEECAKYLWLNAQTKMSNETVERVNAVAAYLKTHGLVLRGVPSDGNCYFHAFLSSYAAFKKKIPILEVQENKIDYLRGLIATRRQARQDPRAVSTAKTIREDGEWITSAEGELLANALEVHMRTIAVNKEGSSARISDLLAFPNKDKDPQEWATLDASEKPQEQIMIVDLGGHFVFARPKKTESRSHVLELDEKPIEDVELETSSEQEETDLEAKWEKMWAEVWRLIDKIINSQGHDKNVALRTQLQARLEALARGQRNQDLKTARTQVKQLLQERAGLKQQRKTLQEALINMLSQPGGTPKEKLEDKTLEQLLDQANEYLQNSSPETKLSGTKNGNSG